VTRLSLPLLMGALAACGNTGSALVRFHAAAAGPSDAVAGQPLVFPGLQPPGASAAYEVTLTRARLHIGAVYLNRSRPISGAQAEPCILPGIYAGQVTSPVDVDALSPATQPFPADGEGTADTAYTGEVWLFGSDVNATDDPTPLVEVAGSAALNGTTYPFIGQFHVGANRAVTVTDPALPGEFPLCKQRIVTGIGIDITLAQGGTLVVRIDPRLWFSNVDFAKVPLDTDPAAPAGQRKFVDSLQAQPDLYGFILGSNAYTFHWQGP